MLFFDTSVKGLGQTFTSLMSGFERLRAEGKIPPHLTVVPIIMNNPQTGSFLAFYCLWLNADLVDGRRHLDNIAELGTVVVNSVSETTLSASTNEAGSFVAPGAWGVELSLRFRELSSTVLALIEKACSKMPVVPNTGIGLHILGSKSPSITEKSYANDSCLNPDARQAHMVLEIYGSSVDQSRMESSVSWAHEFYEELTSSGEVMESSWIPVSKPGSEPEKLFGEKWQLVKDLKEKYDPEGIFDLAVPIL